MSRRFERGVSYLSGQFAKISGISLTLMMGLTTIDVILRVFRHPIPGAYEIVGFLSALVVSFSMAYTALEKGHIAVDFLVAKLPEKAQHIIESINNLCAVVLFGIITWECLVYGTDKLNSGEVSATIQMPVFPFAYGVALGSFLLSLVLLLFLIKSLRRAWKS